MIDAETSLYVELWVSLASLLRSYTAVHGLGRIQQAKVEVEQERILTRHGEKWLELKRQAAIVTWQRENGSRGKLELTDAGRLRDRASAGEEELDMAAEAWARELMQ